MLVLAPLSIAAAWLRKPAQASVATPEDGARDGP
jgi:hypothetical protein